MSKNNQGFLLKKKQKILFEGDSLTARKMKPAYDTWPFLRLMNWERTWPDDFSEILFCLRPDLQLSFRNSAIGGSNSGHVLDRFESCIVPYKPDWVFITIGNNDPHQGITVNQFTKNINEFVDRLAGLSDPKIVFLAGHTSENREKSSPYYKVLKYTASKRNCMYLDVGNVLETKYKQLKKLSDFHTIYSDGVHLNNVGNMIIAGTVLGALGFEWNS